jgi:transposase
MERRQFIREQISRIEQARAKRLELAPDKGPNAMVRLLARIPGIGIETADTLVHEALTRNLRDRRAIARYAGLTGAPNQSGGFNRDKGLARSSNPRVRRYMIGVAWRFLRLQRECPRVKWFEQRTADARGTRKTMIVALARKLLIALWEPILLCGMKAMLHARVTTTSNRHRRSVFWIMPN